MYTEIPRVHNFFNLFLREICIEKNYVILYVTILSEYQKNTGTVCLKYEKLNS